MRIVVVGNSVAGRSVVSLLARSPLASSITSLHVLDNHPYTASESLSSQFYTSLWSPSIDILLNKLNIPVDTWNRLSCAVEESGYRSQAGQWLAQPSRGLQPPPGFPSLCFVKNSTLLQLLDQSSEDVKQRIWHDKYVHHTSTSLQSMKMQDNGKIILSTCKGEQLEADILIAADGTYSTVRKLVTSRGNSSLEHRGYRVYRGILNKTQLSNEAWDQLQYKSSTTGQAKVKGFQTWGPCARFAVVPTNEGLAWYAAITSPEKHSYLPQEQTDPLWNHSTSIKANDHIFLQTFFKQWHQPIHEMIGATKQSHIISSEAIASDRIPTASHSEYFYPKNCKTAIFFVGDAFCTMDPILAQGTGLAIEDSWNVVKALQLLNKPIENLSSEEIQSLEQNVVERRTKRLHTLFQMSNIAQEIGHMNSPLACNIRDIALSVVPSVLKGPAFDVFIRQTSQ